MSDEKTLMTIASASIAGAILSALGHAFSFRDKLKKVETDVDILKKAKVDTDEVHELKEDVKVLKACKSKYLTKEDHDRQCADSKELTSQKLKRIEDKIDAGQKLTENKLNTIIKRINHCQYAGNLGESR